MTLPPDGGPLTPADVAHLRQQLTHGGISWCPEITGLKFADKANADWRDRPDGFDPQQEYRNAYGPLLNSAIILRDAWGIDLDVDDAGDVGGICDVMRATLGPPLCTRHRPNSPRVACLYRQDTDAAYAGLAGSDGAIEVFSGHRAKLTAFGLHTNKKTGERVRMTWDQVPGNITLADLPVASEDAILEFLAGSADWLGEDVHLIRRTLIDGRAGDPMADDIDALCEAMLHVPNAGNMPWGEWNRIGMALFAGCGGDERGLLAWGTWTLEGQGTKHRDWFDRWMNYANSPPTAIGAGTIFKLAIANGYERPALTVTQRRQWREQQAQKTRNKNFNPKI
jgi:hypothetical protein